MKNITRKLIKQKLVDYFESKKLTNISYQIEQENSEEYIIFIFGSGNNIGYADNEILITEKTFYVMYYTINPDLIDKRIIQIKEALNDFNCIDDGTDVYYEKNTELRGVRMTFSGEMLNGRNS